VLAVVGVAVLVVALFALRHPDGRGVKAGTKVVTTTRSATSHASTPPATGTGSGSATGSSAPPTGGTSSAPARLPLVVLNNTTVQDLAKGAAARFRAGGWTVTQYANYQNDIASTCAYYDPAVSGAHEAALALQAQYPTIKRVKPQFSELGRFASPIVVILTPGYAP
jgi:hypothetical protein